jgi:YycE-like protein
MVGTTNKLRVARPPDNLEAVARFYREGLGFAELYRFENHGALTA